MAALDWIKLSCDLPDKWQVAVIRRTLKIRTADEVVGRLYRLWRHFENHSKDGHIPRLVAADLDAVCQKRGFAAAVAAVKWLVLDDAGATVPAYDVYMGAAARKREEDAERKRLQRERDEAAERAGRKADAARTDAGQPRDKGVTAGGQACDQTVTGGDPKRERKSEKKKEAKDPSAAAAAGPVPRDELFDALADVTGSDPKAAGGHIGRVKKLLLLADPPYTAAEVRRFADPAFVAREMPWCDGRKPTLGEVEKFAGRTRNPSVTPPSRPRPPTARQADDEYTARMFADAMPPDQVSPEEFP